MPMYVVKNAKHIPDNWNDFTRLEASYDPVGWYIRVWNPGHYLSWLKFANAGKLDKVEATVGSIGKVISVREGVMI